MVAAPGPLSWVQEMEAMVAPLFPEAVPVRVAVAAGMVMTCATPALTVGGISALWLGMEVSPCRSSHCQTFIGTGAPTIVLMFVLAAVQVVLGRYSVFQQQWVPPP